MKVIWFRLHFREEEDKQNVRLKDLAVQVEKVSYNFFVDKLILRSHGGFLKENVKRFFFYEIDSPF